MATSARLSKRAVTVLAGLALSVLAVRSADASTISWFYTGSVVASFDNALVPVGTSAGILLSLDPADNFAAGAPGVTPNAGGYFFDAAIDFAGRHYDLHGAFEVNEDLVFDHPLPGDILERYLSLTGPKLDPNAPFFVTAPYPVSLCGTPCGYIYPATADPNSPALPVPLQIAAFDLFFLGANGQPVAITVEGGDPQVVPEPASGLLLLTGAIVLISRQREAALAGRPTGAAGKSVFSRAAS